METTTDIHIHVLNNFQVSIPLSGDSNAFVFTQTTSPSFGLTLTRVDTRESFHYQIQMVQLNGSSEEIVSSGLVWAKRAPYQFQKQPNTSIVEALVCTAKITTGIFDFRRNKDRSIRFVVRCFSNDVLLSTGVSQICRIHPKKRLADEESEENNDVIIPIYWALDSAQAVYPQSGLLDASPEHYGDEDSVMANFNDSEDRLQSYSNEVDSDELSLIPTTNASFAISELQPMMPNDHSDQYTVLYNGNAEVIGNFRALNFYKASDIRIKEDVRLLLENEQRDPRSVLLKIDGVEYKFKQGTVHHASVNKRFVGYIAQQIESVVPEAVQLIDGILHVDYESLIPYLSESIKQNFKDINDIKSDTSQIHRIIDLMYKEFINKMNKKVQRSPSTASQLKNRSLARWIISASLTVLLLFSFVIGVVFIVPLVHGASSNINNVQSPNTPSTTLPSDPSNNTPNAVSSNETPTPTFPSPDQEVLVEFYHATDGDNWKVQVAPSTSVCEWAGVACDDNLRVVTVQMIQRGLVGTIPDSIGKLDKLKNLSLRGNSLYGTIPASIGNITGLVELDLGLSQLTGSVPLEMFSLASLSTLAIPNNAFMSWTIPAQISKLKQLKIFNAPSSGLHGTIPNEISQLTQLTWLVLGSNNLTGTVPSLENTNVDHLSLANNKLTGPIPKLNEEVFDGYDEIDLKSNLFGGEFDIPIRILQESYVDVSDNMFTSISVELFNNLTSQAGRCEAKENPFKCPIPDWLQTYCKASCT